MTADKILAALRANAIHHAGDKPPDPKVLARINRLREAFFAEDVFVPLLGESKEQYEGFRQVLLDELNPHSLLQYLLAEQFVYDQWRLLRYRRIETGIIAQAWARNHQALREIRTVPIKDNNDYTYYADETRLGKSRTLADGFGAVTFDRDHFTTLHLAEQRLRKSAIETLSRFYALAPAPGEPDPQPDPQPAFTPAPVVLRYAPRYTFELAKKLGKTLPPDLVPDPNEPPEPTERPVKY